MNKIIRNKSAKLSRRKFVIGSAAAGGGLALGFNLPSGFGAAMAQGVAANGGSDLVYLPGKDRKVAARVVQALLEQDYVSGVFVDASLGRARDAGCGVGDAEDTSWGDRIASVTDPDGYRWVLATFKKLAPFT